MESRKRHCWECRRRYLVCDSAEPACDKCKSSGITCPGYGSAKPLRLRWVEPGKVTSRTRRRRLTAGAKGRAASDAEAVEREPVQSYPPMIPRLQMTTDACNLAQAAQYFNACIYQDLLPMTLLGKSPYVYQISPDHLRQASKAPDFLQFGVLCMTLNHRINRLQHEQAGPLTERFYYYRGIALSSLNQRLRLTGRNTDDVALAGVLTILLVDIQHGASLGWRWHLEGLQKILALRGGVKALANSKSLQPLIHSIWFVAVFGNTTCPAAELHTTRLHLDCVPLITEQYGNAASPFHLCPPALFVEIIGINHLRQQALTNIKMQGLQQRAYDALQRIRNFSYAQWADSKPTSRVVWLLVGDAYRAATTLYCILSLQSQPVFLDTASLRGQCLSAGRNLQRLLEGPLSHQHIRRFMLWPLVILGVHAKTDGTMRSFVACELSNLSCQIGTYAPLTAKSMLERFWSSDETGWDACFDKPYAFTMQIAVDTSGIIDPL